MIKSFDESVNISEVYFECFAIVQDIAGYYGVIRDKKQDGLRKNNMINNLGEGSIPKLMAKLAIPAVVAQVVNLLYNIVDRIYIGHIPQIGADALTRRFLCFLMHLQCLPVRVEHQGLLFIWVRKIMLRQRKLSGTVLHF